MPNARKLMESHTETSTEVSKKMDFNNVIIPISSGTIAAGVIKGFHELKMTPRFILHMGYSRSHEEVEKYVRSKSGAKDADIILIDEGYQYKDKSHAGSSPPFPCNDYYDLKAFRWWLMNRNVSVKGSTLFWNIG